ncbi:MAG: hypothetical protein ACJA08_001187 [Cyclobacteriaceae bacterium]
MKNHIIHTVLIIICLSGCVETDIVDRYTSAQVEHLLSNSDIKTWFLSEKVVNGVRIPIEKCQDTSRWVFELIATDSIASYELVFDAQCVIYDTTFFGAFSASAIGDVFTDTLKFSGGNKSLMFPAYIRSESFSVNYTENGDNVIALLTDTRSDYLSRQVAFYLTDGNSAGDEREWLVKSLSVEGRKQSINDCLDSVRFVFNRNAQSNIQMNQIVPVDSCRSSETIYFGEIAIPTSSTEGFFENQLTISGGVTEEIVVSSFATNQFSASYKIDTLDYVVTYVAE